MPSLGITIEVVGPTYVFLTIEIYSGVGARTTSSIHPLQGIVCHSCSPCSMIISSWRTLEFQWPMCIKSRCVLFFDQNLRNSVLLFFCLLIILGCFVVVVFFCLCRYLVRFIDLLYIGYCVRMCAGGQICFFHIKPPPPKPTVSPRSCACSLLLTASWGWAKWSCVCKPRDSKERRFISVEGLRESRWRPASHSEEGVR